MEIRKLTPHIGAEILGVDLAQLDEPAFKVHPRRPHRELRDLLPRSAAHRRPAQGISAGASASSHIHPAAPGARRGHPEILVIHADEKSKRVAGENWHSDVSCDAEPPMGSILYMHELPPVGGDTLFASMYAAYDALSEPLKRLLEGDDRDPPRRARLSRHATAWTIATASSRRRSIRSSAPIPSPGGPRSS